MCVVLKSLKFKTRCLVPSTNISPGGTPVKLSEVENRVQRAKFDKND